MSEKLQPRYLRAGAATDDPPAVEDGPPRRRYPVVYSRGRLATSAETRLTRLRGLRSLTGLGASTGARRRRRADSCPFVTEA